MEFQSANKQGNEQQSWIDMISIATNNSESKKNKYQYLTSHFPEFYKFRHILISDFEEQANTGDIMLFRSTHNAARAQQMLLNSEYGKQIVILRSCWSCFEE